ncbi:hypothetical protein HMN09_00794600 [Mycena chlorophos]|uniref:Uncharacterized protein n=1 Tax=Mycena chlorophos TaxID=658473 RepID=A0A8H6SV63_MYCCL|nr:hypothetical protein HMN09_00794600 [Mycena chlorophos]
MRGVHVFSLTSHGPSPPFDPTGLPPGPHPSYDVLLARHERRNERSRLRMAKKRAELKGKSPEIREEAAERARQARARYRQKARETSFPAAHMNPQRQTRKRAVMRDRDPEPELEHRPDPGSEPNRLPAHQNDRVPPSAPALVPAHWHWHALPVLVPVPAVVFSGPEAAFPTFTYPPVPPPPEPAAPSVSARMPIAQPKPIAPAPAHSDDSLHRRPWTPMR